MKIDIFKAYEKYWIFEVLPKENVEKSNLEQIIRKILAATAVCQRAKK